MPMTEGPLVVLVGPSVISLAARLISVSLQIVSNHDVASRFNETFLN